MFVFHILQIPSECIAPTCTPLIMGMMQSQGLATKKKNEGRWCQRKYMTTKQYSILVMYHSTSKIKGTEVPETRHRKSSSA
jgi:hypothetical protein